MDRDAPVVVTDKLTKKYGQLTAVDDLSFGLAQGQSLALIGRNGAGKSTLLKMLNGLIKPDRGSIRIRGRVGARFWPQTRRQRGRAGIQTHERGCLFGLDGPRKAVGKNSHANPQGTLAMKR